jgi:hypothetical protein
MTKYKYASVPGLESTIDDPDIRMTFKTFGWGDPKDSSGVKRLTTQEIFDAMFWIPVTERLPEPTVKGFSHARVLAIVRAINRIGKYYHFVVIAEHRFEYNLSKWFTLGTYEIGNKAAEVTHWMPLPKLPEGI